MKFFEKLKERWGITSNVQVVIIFFVFGITGSSSLKVGKPILEFFNINEGMSPWVFWPLRILIIFPVYQVLLLFFGALCGQFQFFWNMVKKTMGRMVPGLNKNKQKA
jgi:manganese efflux pump family protein